MNEIANYFTLAYICDHADTSGTNPTSGVEIVSKRKLPLFKPGKIDNVAHRGHLVRRGNWAGTEIFELVCDQEDEETWVTVLKKPVSFHEDFYEERVCEKFTADGWIGNDNDLDEEKGAFILLELKEGAIMKEGRNIVHFLNRKLNYRTPGYVFCLLEDSLQND